MARVPAETVRGVEFRRKVRTPMAGGRSRWEYSTSFLMDQPTGYWHVVDVRRLGEKVSRSTWQTSLGMKPERLTAGGAENDIDRTPSATMVRTHKSEYPSGVPLADAETKARRNNRHNSHSDGQCARLGFPQSFRLAGPPGCMWKSNREMIRTARHRPLIQTKLPRRGGPFGR